jgi:large subunit ribosomal protein L31
MKKELHPKNYRPVIFLDNSSKARFLINSTVNTKEKGTWDDGKEYPLYSVEISSASHPFYTGNETVIDTAGRVEKFKARTAKTATKAVKKADAKK